MSMTLRSRRVSQGGGLPGIEAGGGECQGTHFGVGHADFPRGEEPHGAPGGGGATVQSVVGGGGRTGAPGAGEPHDAPGGEGVTLRSGGKLRQGAAGRGCDDNASTYSGLRVYSDEDTARTLLEPETALDEPQAKRFRRETHAPAANNLLTASQGCFKCMKDVKWKIRTKLPPEDELQKQSLEFINDLLQCQECWNIQGHRTSCTCIQMLRGNQDMVCYLARVKCAVQKMRVKDKDMYEHYAKLLMKEHACEVKRGLHPLPRLPKEEDSMGLSMSSILPDLANRRICRGLWRRIIGCNRPQYIEFEKSALFEGISQEVNTNHDINDLLHQINPDYDKLVVDADLLRSEVHGNDAIHVATFRH